MQHDINAERAERVLKFGTLVISVPVVTDKSEFGQREKLVAIFRRGCSLAQAEAVAAEFFDMNRHQFDMNRCSVRWLPPAVWL